MNKENSLDKFLRQKKVSGLLNSDKVFEKHAVNGLDTNTMLFQDGTEESTLYRSVEENGTTYMSISDSILNEIDDKTVTVRDNINQKNAVVNSMVIANSVINDSTKKEEELIKMDSDALLLSVHMREPRIDFRDLKDFLSPANEVHKYIQDDIKTPLIQSMINSIIDGTYDTAKSKVSDKNRCRFLNYVPIKSTSEPKGTEYAKEAGSPEEMLSSKLDADEEEETTTESEFEQTKGSITTNINDGKTDYDSWFSEEPTLSKKDFETIEQLAKRLSSKLKGRFGKDKVISPSKRIHIKNFIRKNPSMYIKKRDAAKGKKVNVNILMDVSGSMSGDPVKNAISVAMIFEYIANVEKTVTGNLILSAREGSKAIEFGHGSSNLMSKVEAFSSSEGIEKAITANTKILQKADFNICISDAQITDDPINKKKYEAKNIFIDAMYIGKVSNGSKQIEHMEDFFSRARILPNLEEAVEYITNVVLSK